MLFLLKSMNRILNQNRFRVYPKTGPVPEAPGAPLPAGIDILFQLGPVPEALALPEVAERYRCRKMFVVQSHELSPGSRRSSRSHRDVDGIVVQGASSRVKTLPKNLIARVPCRTFSEQRFRRPALARAMRATLGRRERSPKQEYLKQECLWCEDEWRRVRLI